MELEVLNLYRECLLQNDVVKVHLELLESQKKYMSVICDKAKQVEIDLRIKNCNLYLEKIQSSLEQLYNILKKDVLGHLNYAERIVFREYILKDKTMKEVCDEYKIAPSSVRNLASKIYKQLGDIKIKEDK